MMIEALTRPAVSLLAAVLLLVGFAIQSESDPVSEDADHATLRIEMDPLTVDIPAGVDLIPDLLYAERAGRALHLDLYRPQATAERLPVVVYIHGGGWRSGSKQQPPIVELAAEGYALVSIEYRLSDEAVFPAQLDDCREALRWLRTHADEWSLDPDRIGVCGFSSGGHLAALLGVNSPQDPHEAALTRVQAVADFFGPTDLLTLSRDNTDNEGRFTVDVFSPEALLLGTSPQSDPERARSASPMSYVEAGRQYPPFYILHGHADNVVPWRQSYRFALALRKCGADVTYHSPESGHQSVLLSQQIDDLCAFFDQALAPGKSLVPSESPAAPEIRLSQHALDSGRDAVRHKPRRKRSIILPPMPPAAS
ncbi:alpha/beta hydrolase fold domain-containing protein [bacterium]|nr:alpha/beta hydrolase fold domain-containing protein [bacterium]